METRKLWTALVAVAALSVFLAVSATPAAATATADTAVRALERAGILEGTNCSSQDCDGNLLRGEAALWLANALELEPDTTVSIADVPAGTIISGAVTAIAREGLTHGCATAPFRFCSDNYTTREQMASFLSRGFDLRVNRRAVFSDVDPLSVHSRNISTIWKAGITEGCETEPLRYCPADPITRRQGAVMLYRALQRDDAGSGSSQQNSNDGRPGSGGGNPGSTVGNPGSGGGPTGTPPPPSQLPCPVADSRNPHHDIDDHLGDPSGEISYALLPDGTLFGHRHDPGGGTRCWMWAPPDKDGNGSNPVNVAPPSHSH